MEFGKLSSDARPHNGQTFLSVGECFSESSNVEVFPLTLNVSYLVGLYAGLVHGIEEGR